MSPKLPPAQVAELLDDPGFTNAIIERGAAAEAAVAEFFPKPGALSKALRQVTAKRKIAAEREVRPSVQPYYIEHEGGLAIVAVEGANPVPFTNFIPKIVEEILCDDGVERRRTFLVSCEGLESIGAEVRVSPSEMVKNGWHLEKFGAQAQVRPIPHANDHLVAAMQQISRPAKRVLFAHTGWATVGDQEVFLHADGAVGAPGVQTTLEGAHARYRLPPTTARAADAVHLSLQLLQAAPLRISMPLFLVAYRGALNPMVPMDVMVHVHGLTGAMKSTIVSLALSHFGDFDHDQLPISWYDTEAAIEHALFTLKDVPVVIDDFAPSTNDPKDEQRRKIAKVGRSIGNRSSRARMRSDMSKHPNRPPRSVVISTGEDLPREGSILARTLIVPMQRGDAVTGVISRIQADRAVLPHAMLAFIEWLAPRMSVLRFWLPRKFLELRSRFQRAGRHLRAPAAAAHLAIAGEVFSRFAMDLGVFDLKEARRFREMMIDSLVDLLELQSQEQRRTDPVAGFLRCLEELLAQGKLVLIDKVGHSPLRDAENIAGFQDTDHFFLLEKIAYSAVSEALRRAGEPLQVSGRALWQQMHGAGILIREEADHLTVKRLWPVDGSEKRFLRLSRDEIALKIETARPMPAKNATVIPLPGMGAVGRAAP